MSSTPPQAPTRKTENEILYFSLAPHHPSTVNFLTGLLRRFSAPTLPNLTAPPERPNPLNPSNIGITPLRELRRRWERGCLRPHASPVQPASRTPESPPARARAHRCRQRRRVKVIPSFPRPRSRSTRAPRRAGRGLLTQGAFTTSRNLSTTTPGEHRGLVWRQAGPWSLSGSYTPFI